MDSLSLLNLGPVGSDPLALELTDSVRALMPELVETRRDFHRWPELSFHEVHTAARIAQALHGLGLEVRAGVARTGLVATLRGAKPGRTLLVRSDIDALPLQEEASHSYASRNPGVMHACGHDAHMAILLGTIRLLVERRDRLAGAVKFVFQPAEEGPGGADMMIAEGVLQDPQVDAAVGYHVWNELPVGVVGVRPGPLMASSDEFEIAIHGQGGHGADPHLAVDAVVVAAHVVTALQTIVSRAVSPLESVVLTVGTIAAGSGHNIIAQTATMRGTIRTFNEELRATMPRRLEQIAKGVAQALGADAEIVYKRQYPVTYNDPGITAMVRAAAEQAIGVQQVVKAEPTMGAEDMAYFLQEVPGTYFLIGSANPEAGLDKPHHHPGFDIDEHSLGIGVRVLTRVVLDYLSE